MTFSYSYMENGRPYGHGRFYNPDGFRDSVLTTKEKTDVKGWAYYVGDVIDGLRAGDGKCYFPDGRVFDGKWENKVMKKGKMSYLEEDGTRHTKLEIFCYQNDIENGVDSYS